MSEATKNLSCILFATLFMLTITLTSVGTASPADVKIAVDPPKVNDVEPGNTFTVNITANNIVISELVDELCNGLIGWDVKLKFNSKILNIVEVTEGPFLKTVRNETTWEVGYQEPSIDNDEGILTIGNTFLPEFPSEGATGSGTLATITFDVVSRGSTSLSLETTILYTWIPPDINYRMEHTTVDGSFDNGTGIGLSTELIIAIVAVVIVCGAGLFFYMRRRRA